MSAALIAHIDRRSIGARHAIDPGIRLFVGADARRDERHTPDAAALRERRTHLRGGSERGRHARHDFVRDTRCFECRDLFLRAAEEHRVAAFQPHDDRMRLRRVDQALVDKALCGRMLPAALADRDPLRPYGELERLRMHERVVEHDVGLREQPRSAQRQKVRCTRTGTDQVDRADGLGMRTHRTIPAATVALVASSIRTKLPVARLST